MKRFVFALLATAAFSAPVLADQALATAKNCMACHAVDKKVVGPAYQDVAKKYGATMKADELAKRGLAWYVGAMPTYSTVYGAFATVPIFLLVPQVKLRKRLDLARDAERAIDGVPGRIGAIRLVVARAPGRVARHRARDRRGHPQSAGEVRQGQGDDARAGALGPREPRARPEEARWALAVEPENQSLQTWHLAATQQRESMEATVPSTIARELACNPFMRVQQDSVAHAAAQWAKRTLETPVEIFAALREWKNNFR